MVDRELVARERARAHPAIKQAEDLVMSVSQRLESISVLQVEVKELIAQLERTLLQFYTVTNAVKLIGISHGAIVRRVKRGHYLGAFINGVWYVDKEQIDDEVLELN